MAPRAVVETPRSGATGLPPQLVIDGRPVQALAELGITEFCGGECPDDVSRAVELFHLAGVGSADEVVAVGQALDIAERTAVAVCFLFPRLGRGHRGLVELELHDLR